MSLGMSGLLPHVSFISCMNAVTRFKSCRVTRRQEVNSSFKMLCWLLWKPEGIHFASYLPIKKVKILQGQGLPTLNFGKCTLAKTFLVSTSFENKTWRPNKTFINSHIAFKSVHRPINILGVFFGHAEIRSSLGRGPETALSFVQTPGMCLPFISFFVSGTLASQAVS